MPAGCLAWCPATRSNPAASYGGAGVRIRNHHLHVEGIEAVFSTYRRAATDFGTMGRPPV
jgi:hypothetical protein